MGMQIQEKMDGSESSHPPAAAAVRADAIDDARAR